ncbi:hypothetical protein NT6N_16030 [Oceaniferula spumae]|uniref:Autotransporter domain-containing protein n=1 Tax=Oceaniferula spumae TaxID=2979115 RepID=A0AAT9FKU4_9BACT
MNLRAISYTLSVVLPLSVHAAIQAIGDTTPTPDNDYWNTGTGFNSTVYVGFNNPGSVIVDGGSSITSHTLYVGENAGVIGDVNVTGAGSVWNIENTLEIGYLGVATFRIGDGGVVNVGSFAGIDVHGVGGSGKLILDGGTLNASNWISDTNEIEGTGVINANGYAGNGFPTSYTFDGSNVFSFLIDNDRSDAITFNLTANPGFVMDRSAVVEGGAVFTIQNATIGNDEILSQSLDVSGAGTELTISESLEVAKAGDGSVEVSGGATLQVDGTTSIDPNGAHTGSILLNNGTFKTELLVGDAIDFSGQGSLELGGVIGSGFSFQFLGSNAGTQLIDNGRGDLVSATLDATNIPAYTGSLSLANGAVLTAVDVTGGRLVGESDQLTLAGSGTSLSISNQLTLGDLGEGAASVLAGTGLDATKLVLGNSEGSQGSLKVEGADALLDVTGSMIVGLSGAGSMSISSGSDADAGLLVLGQNTTATGTANINGGAISTGEFIAGQGGSAIFNIKNDGSLTATNVTLAQSSTASAEVSIDGSDTTFDASEQLIVGDAGAAVLSIGGGATATANEVFVSKKDTGAGSVVISGQGSVLTVDADLNVGSGNVGSVEIADGAVVDIGASTIVYSGSGLTFDMGTLNTKALHADSDVLLGTGTINANGVFGTGYNFTFDGQSEASLQLVNGEGTIDVHLDVSTGLAPLSGNISVLNGGQISSTAGSIGLTPGVLESSSVSGASSSWSISGDLSVGDLADGELLVATGGAMSSNALYLGRHANAEGDLSVEGDGSIFTGSGDLIVAEHGVGRLSVASGGTMGGVLNGYVGLESGSSGIVVLDGNESRLQLNGIFQIGGWGDAQVSITNGASLVHAGVANLSEWASSTARMEVKGEGSVWKAGEINLGRRGTTEIVISEGGVVQSGAVRFSGSRNSESYLTVRDTGSRLVSSQSLVVGNSGYGEMNILNGGEVQSHFGYIGLNGAPSGHVLISGEGSAWNMTRIFQTANVAPSYLKIVGGASLNAQFAELGMQRYSETLVSGSGSKWTISNEFDLGLEGEAVFEMEDGATGTSSTLHIGRNAGGTGVLRLKDSGTQFTNSNAAYIGNSGRGSLEVTLGGVLSTGAASLGHDTTGVGNATIEGSGSRWTVRGGLDVANAGEGNLLIRNQASTRVRDSLNIAVSGEASGEINIFAAESTLLEVGYDGSGALVNNGSLRLFAGAELAAGTYSPAISADGFSGSGSYQAFGGSWDIATGELAVNAIENSASNSLNEDLSGRRLAFNGGALVSAFEQGVGMESFSVDHFNIAEINFGRVVESYSISLSKPALLSFDQSSVVDTENLQVYYRAGSGDEWHLISDTPSQQSGNWYSVLAESSGDYALVYTGYENALVAFRDIYGLAEDGADDDQDWSGNGIPNLLYLAFGLGDPNGVNIDRTRLPAIGEGNAGNTIAFSFVEPIANDTGLEIEVRTSEDLSQWFTPDELGLNYLPVNATTEDLGDGYQRVTQIYGILAGEDGRFYRVKVSSGTSITTDP